MSDENKQTAPVTGQANVPRIDRGYQPDVGAGYQPGGGDTTGPVNVKPPSGDTSIQPPPPATDGEKS